jgi:hypothetical protein
MVKVDLATVQKVVAAIKVERNPQAQTGGFRKFVEDCFK